MLLIPFYNFKLFMEENMNKRMLFIYNPKAGKAKIRNKLADILDIFAADGYEITICPTQKQGDATEFMRN